MYALAALIEYAARFNRQYAPKNIHLKVFVAGEVLHYLKENVLQNPLKAVRDPVYLLWRPGDLLRFISWRLYRHLEETGLWDSNKGDIDWEDYDQVLRNVWIPHFGRSLTNARNQVEDTWPYVLRHTQMRPRQLILLCNAIAKRAVEDGTFPRFEETHIVNGIKDAESDLASEVLNSFSEIYPGADRIVRALMEVPKVFTGNELDKRAHRSSKSWPPGEYDPYRFSQMLAELGIVGRVTRPLVTSLKDISAVEWIDADFEYATTQRLELTAGDVCVVHPMFYRRLNVKLDSAARVMPFTTSR